MTAAATGSSNPIDRLEVKMFYIPLSEPFPSDHHRYLMPGQRWLPHEVHGNPHPFVKGQIVSVGSWLARKSFFGAKVSVVSDIRTFKYYRRREPVDQVEILGLPGRWFSVSHFDR